MHGEAPREYSAILSTFIKLPFVLKTFVLSFFERQLKTGFTVYTYAWVKVQNFQNPEFRNNPENFHPCICYSGLVQEISVLIESSSSQESGESVELCSCVQTCRYLRCLHRQSMDVDEGS